MATSVIGGCLCGAVRYEITSKYLNAMNCYCGMCRKVHGGAYSTHLIVRPERLRWIEGRDRLVPYKSSAEGVREFCPPCGTHILVHGQTGDGMLAVPAGTIDGRPEITLRGHIFTDDLVPWHCIADDLPQHAKWPPGYGSD